MRRVLWTVLLMLVATLLLWHAGAEFRRHHASAAPSAPERAAASARTILFDGCEWTELVTWDFADSLYPGGWGWGNIEIADSTLELTDPSGATTVYMLPATHTDDFLLETLVQPVCGAGQKELSAHLISRDSNSINHETGLAVFANTDRALLRHRINGLEYPGGVLHTGHPLDYGAWHLLRLASHDSTVCGSIDGSRPFGIARHAGGLYNEPHLSVSDGTARFKYFKLYERAYVYSQAVPLAASPFDNALWQSPRTASLLLPVRGMVRILLYTFYAVIALVILYTIRHYAFALNRMFGRQRHPYLDVDTADWPHVTVLIPAQDEEGVIAAVLTALLEADYPADRMTIVAINDRSRDRTGKIIDEFQARYPGRVQALHRREGLAGKAAALQDAMQVVEDEVVLVFDADYVPGRNVVRQLVAPFFDPEVGAVMGRVVPHNVEQNLLTRLLDLERAGGYQVDQQARMNLHLTPQYGGTVGGIRKSALESIGGWRADSLAEDTDATLRLLVKGWKTVYQNRTECYEQVPSTWPMRIGQVGRWARGHNQALSRYFLALLRSPRASFAEKLDGVMLLNIYMMSPVLLLGWGVGTVLWYMGICKPGLIVILLVTAYSTLGNFATFFEVSTAAYLDGSRGRIRLMPFLLLGFLVNLVSVTRATLAPLFSRQPREDVSWHRTDHGDGRGGRP